MSIGPWLSWFWASSDVEVHVFFGGTGLKWLFAWDWWLPLLAYTIPVKDNFISDTSFAGALHLFSKYYLDVNRRAETIYQNLIKITSISIREFKRSNIRAATSFCNKLRYS